MDIKKLDWEAVLSRIEDSREIDFRPSTHYITSQPPRCGYLSSDTQSQPVQDEKAMVNEIIYGRFTTNETFLNIELVEREVGGETE